MLDVLAFTLYFIIVFLVCNGVRFIGKFELGKIVLFIYLVIRIVVDLTDLLVKFLK